MDRIEAYRLDSSSLFYFLQFFRLNIIKRIDYGVEV